LGEGRDLRSLGLPPHHYCQVLIGKVSWGMARIWQWREEEAGSFLAEAREVLARGGVLALPTETFYALAVDPFQEGALSRLFSLKERPSEKPVLLLVASPEMLTRVVREVPEIALKLIRRFWPGPLTLILPARPDLPAMLTGGTATVGVRQPRHAVTCRLLDALGFPVTGTSANRSGQKPRTRAEEVAREFGEGLDLILDAGPCPGGEPSTIVDVSRTPPRLVRPGAVAAAKVAELLPELTRI
jgi:L-threonylcarbamoyladenylate synthase